MIYLYYITRFPYQQFKLFNCGSGGDTATGTLTRRMDGDILVHRPTIATIMLGMNDIWWENSNLLPADSYTRDLGGIIDRLKAEKSQVILITPSPYDYSVKSEEPVDPKRLGLERLAGEVIKLGKERNIPVVDFYNPMHQITLEQQIIDSTFTLLVKDRVHTKPLADFIMGYTFIKATNPCTFVSKVMIDAKYSSVCEQINCLVENLYFNKESVRFSLAEKALPYPKVAIPGEASGLIGFEKEMNQEILQIKGLESGKYTLYIDSIDLGNHPASEFSQGINLAEIINTPQNKQAALLAEIITEYTSAVKNIRYIAMIEYGELKKRYAIDDVSTPKADILKHFSELSADFDEYLKLKTKESFWMKMAEELDNKLWENNKPQTHYYHIRKIK